MVKLKSIIFRKRETCHNDKWLWHSIDHRVKKGTKNLVNTRWYYNFEENTRGYCSFEENARGYYSSEENTIGYYSFEE